MALELKQQLRLSQQLVMTPQLQQAIKLLQLSRLELVGLVQQELEENPVLEEALEGDDEPALASSAEAQSEAASQLPGETEVTQPEAAAGEPAASSEREPTDAEKLADVDWQSYADDYAPTGPREIRDDSERPSIEATLTRRATLAEHLQWQLQLSGFPPTRSWRRSSSSATSMSAATCGRISKRLHARPVCPSRWWPRRWLASRSSIRRGSLRAT
jgi:RNA polymerase sigma-54 factor